MKRQLCATALVAVILIPDWASACWGRDGIGFGRAYYAPAYYGPVCYVAQPVCCPPAYPQPVFIGPGTVAVPMQPPRVVPGKGKSDSSLTEPRPIARPVPAPAPEVDPPVRPAANVESIPAKPQAASPKTEPAPAPTEKRDNIPPTNISPPELPTIPKPGAAPKMPPLELPKVDAPKIDAPKPDAPKVDAPKPPLIPLPTDPGTIPKLPAFELPKVGPDPKLPALELPGGGSSAVPVPAPAPDALVPLPAIPAPKNPDSLPPLTLPPDTPVAPDNEKAKEKAPKAVEVKSSPIGTAARELKVSVFPATGNTAATGLRKVGFYNHTTRDLALTIEGKSVTLPARTYLHAQLPATFTWSHADAPGAKETVPAAAAGLDVVIRE